MKRPIRCYAVLFTYNFDNDSSVYLFDDFESAQEFLKNAYNEEVRVETEENGWDVDATHTDDWTFAKIVHDGYGFSDACEYRLTSGVFDIDIV